MRNMDETVIIEFLTVLNEIKNTSKKLENKLNCLEQKTIQLENNNKIIHENALEAIKRANNITEIIFKNNLCIKQTKSNKTNDDKIQNDTNIKNEQNLNRNKYILLMLMTTIFIYFYIFYFMMN